MLSRLLADVVVLAHLAYLVFIPVGGFLAWRWPKVIPAHLAAIAVAIVSITAGFDCPLTTWENSLRKAGGEKPEILHQAQFEERIYASPALGGDKFYLRTKSALYAFGDHSLNK